MGHEFLKILPSWVLFFSSEVNTADLDVGSSNSNSFPFAPLNAKWRNLFSIHIQLEDHQETTPPPLLALRCILYLHRALSHSVELCPNPPFSLPTQETVLGNVPFSQTAQCLLCRPRKTCQDEYVISISTLTCMMHGSVSKKGSHHFTTLANTKFPKKASFPHQWTKKQRTKQLCHLSVTQVTCFEL